MPLTRLANAVIDAIAERGPEVSEEVAKYLLVSDSLFHRAATSARVGQLQAQHWDPVLAWAHDALGARFVLVEGHRVRAAHGSAQLQRAAILTEPNNLKDIWRLGAVASVTTLTGSVAGA